MKFFEKMGLRERDVVDFELFLMYKSCYFFVINWCGFGNDFLVL